MINLVHLSINGGEYYHNKIESMRNHASFYGCIGALTHYVHRVQPLNGRYSAKYGAILGALDVVISHLASKWFGWNLGQRAQNRNKNIIRIMALTQVVSFVFSTIISCVTSNRIDELFMHKIWINHFRLHVFIITGSILTNLALRHIIYWLK